MSTQIAAPREYRCHDGTAHRQGYNMEAAEAKHDAKEGCAKAEKTEKKKEKYNEERRVRKGAGRFGSA